MFAAIACGSKDDEPQPNQENNQENNSEQTDPKDNNSSGVEGSTLLVFYSYTGSIKSIADEFLKNVDADVLEIQPAQEGLKYEADNYKIGSELIAAIRNAPDDKASYPEIKPYEIDLSKYSNIVVATPLWWSNMAAPMQTFLFECGKELKNKNLYLIVSSASSGISSVIEDAKRLCDGANFVGNELWINNSKRGQMPELVKQWIDNHKFTKQMTQKLIITVGGKSLTADFAQNSSAEALIEALKKSPITYQAHDYGGFEKVGDLGVSFPQNNEQITTSPGDIILYQGNNLCIYYGKNTWNFTRIAKIQDVGKEDLLDFLGDGEIEVKLEVK